MALQNIRWERNSFYPIDEYIKKLPVVIKEDTKFLLLSSEILELTKSAENILENFKHQLVKKGAELPIP